MILAVDDESTQIRSDSFQLGLQEDVLRSILMLTDLLIHKLSEVLIVLGWCGQLIVFMPGQNGVLQLQEHLVVIWKKGRIA
jgi:hypothetical protein